MGRVSYGRRILGALAAAGCVLAGFAGPAFAGPVTAFQQDAAHTGSSPDRLAGPFTRVWSTDLGLHVSYPVVAEGKVFVLASGVWFPGDPFARYAIYALDRETGRVEWTRPLVDGRGPSATPLTYENGRLLLGLLRDETEAAPSSGAIAAFDAASGEPLWETGPLPSWWFAGPPVASDGVVYLVGAGRGATLYAVRTADGHRLWTEPVISGGHAGGVALSRTHVYVSDACNAWSFERADGALAWAYDGGCAGAPDRTPVLAGNQLYARVFGATGSVLDARTGTLVDSFDVEPFTDPPPAVAGGTMVRLSGGALEAFALGSTTPLWSFRGDEKLASAPIIAGDTVFIGGSSGRVFGVDLNTGQQIWSAEAGEPVRPPERWDNTTTPGLAVSDDLLLVPATGRLVAFRGRVTAPPPVAAPQHTAPPAATTTRPRPSTDASQPARVAGRLIRVRGATLRDLRQGTMRVVARCFADCTATVKLKLRRRAARRYRIPTTIASHRVNIERGERIIRLRLRREARTKLAGARAARAQLAVKLKTTELSTIAFAQDLVLR